MAVAAHVPTAIGMDMALGALITAVKFTVRFDCAVDWNDTDAIRTGTLNHAHITHIHLLFVALEGYQAG